MTTSLEGTQCAYQTRAKEIWSLGTDTLDACTHATGWWPERASGRTDRRC